jgi:hypothetical protein
MVKLIFGQILRFQKCIDRMSCRRRRRHGGGQEAGLELHYALLSALSALCPAHPHLLCLPPAAAPPGTPAPVPALAAGLAPAAVELLEVCAPAPPRPAWIRLRVGCLCACAAPRHARICGCVSGGVDASRVETTRASVSVPGHTRSLM